MLRGAGLPPGPLFTAVPESKEVNSMDLNLGAMKIKIIPICCGFRCKLDTGFAIDTILHLKYVCSYVTIQNLTNTQKRIKLISN